jgi:hypothetical protein
MESEAKGVIPASPMMEEPKDEIKVTWKIPEYNDGERTYLSRLQKKLENAKLVRENPHTEFDGMTYTQYWQKNEDLANVKIQPKQNKQDIQYQSGTLRTKLFAFLSSLLGLNLKGDITAFNANDVVINQLGDGIEDVIDKCDEMDEDEEKKMLRQYEMLKQGDVFVEEIWEDKWIIEKQPIENYNGKFRGVKIKKKEVKKFGSPVRNVVSGLGVYLGDLTKYLISEQPYIFTVQTKSYDETEQIYKDFEMWQYVSKTLNNWSGDSDKAMTQNAWRLLGNQENKCEIIKYQSKIDSEYQTIINGVPMFPPGFPFPWGYDEYNLTQQHLKPIRHDFAYGKSFTFENKNPIQLLDEFMKMGLLKTQKSLLGVWLNLSGKVISQRVLAPGTISMGIPQNSLVPISDKMTEGMTPAEFSMIQELIKDIDTQTASQTFTGSKEKGNVTATQIIELQRQARIMLGIIILSATLLEKKLITLRMMNILKRWFDPIDETIDTARKELKNRYRIVSRFRTIEGEGAGVRYVVPTEKLPSAEEVKKNEDDLKVSMGMPVKIIAINPKELKETKVTWVVTVNPRERRSSEMGKLMFRGMIADANALGLRLSPVYIQERFAEVWEEDPSKLYEKGAPEQPPMVVEPPQAGAGQGGGIPVIKAPKVAVNKQAGVAPSGIL